MALADAEHDAFADLAAERVARGVRHEGAAEFEVGVVGEKALFKIARVKDGRVFLIRRMHSKALLRKQLRGDVGAAVQRNGVDQAAVAHAICQGCNERWVRRFRSRKFRRLKAKRGAPVRADRYR